MEAPSEEPGAPGTSEALEVAKGGVTFVLEGAFMEVAKVGHGYVILSGEEHKDFIGRHKKDPAHYRPDILHQTLLSILDSPLNKAGKIKAVYVHTAKNVLFEVNVHTRLPRTLKRFNGLMVQLLQKLSIRATNGPDKLLKVVKGPVTRYLPTGCPRVGLSHKAPGVKKMGEILKEVQELQQQQAVFVVGGIAHGKVDASYCDTWTSISQFPLSASVCVSRICSAFETHWDII